MDKLSRGTKRSLPDSFAAESSPGAKRRRSDEEQGIAETLSALAQDTAPLQPFDVVHAIGVINIEQRNQSAAIFEAAGRRNPDLRPWEALSPPRLPRPCR